MHTTPRVTKPPREERKSVTETDLFAAEGGTEQASLSTPQSTSETPSHGGAGDETAASAPATASAPDTAAQSGVATAPDNGTVTTTPDGSLSAMVLPELRALANRVGVKGASGMRKNDLIAAIRAVNADDGGTGDNGGSGGETPAGAQPQAAEANGGEPARAEADEAAGAGAAQAPPRRERRSAGRDTGAAAAGGDQDKQGESRRQGGESRKQDKPDEKGEQSGGRREGGKSDEPAQSKGDDQNRGQQNQGQQNQGDQNRGQQNQGQQNSDDDEGRGGRRGRRFRDRRRRGERGGDGGDAELRDDDVVQPVAGSLDVLDNYAFVRTSGYLAGPNDVYVSMNMVRKNGLRRGDAVTGAVRVPRDGEQPNQRQKFNPLVRLDTVNGGPVEDAKKRPDFSKLTPLYPNQRLRLETATEKLTTRVIDLIMPIGKGQRALIVSPPKAGKTTIMQDIANAITRNNPECHLMVVLVDERPEEVTDMQRSVKGEVIASTFDRPPSDHTQAAELAIERAKRLVEQGKDVVVLLDSITRLGRAYNNASPASGRILSGGVDSTALYPPKRFLGAARNIEDGGSLTIIATAMVETGSTGDNVIFEEFKRYGRAELKLLSTIDER